MLRSDEIQKTLHASRVIDLNIASMHGPLGLEQLAAVVQNVQSQPQSMTGDGDEALTITVRAETRQKLERLAIAHLCKPARHVSAAELAAAIVEHFVSSAAG